MGVTYSIFDIHTEPNVPQALLTPPAAQVCREIMTHLDLNTELKQWISVSLSEKFNVMSFYEGSVQKIHTLHNEMQS